MMNGFLIADKGTGMTSSNLVVYVRRRLPKGTAIGHGGTLDPDASGVLPLCIGRATRLFDYIIDKRKTYVAELLLGQTTDTQDAGGRILTQCPVDADEAALREVLSRFVGEIEQIPPMYSAIKRDGQRLYKLARKGESVELEPRRCRVEGIDFLEACGENRYRIRVHCGKGVYIRTLCHDIGAALGCGATMMSLRRISAGAFTLENALTKDEIGHLAEEGKLETALLPMDFPLGHLPKLDVSGSAAAHAVKNGNPLYPRLLDGPAPEGDAIRIYLDGRFAGIGKREADGSVRFRCMLLEDNL